MRINKDLPHFDKEKALIIATGEHKAFLYVANKGDVILADSFMVEKPDFTDIKEGKFSNGSSISGGVYELQKQNTQNIFLNMLKDRINLLDEKEELDSLYLFSPQYMTKAIEKALHGYGGKLKMIRGGNLVNHHPFELLKKIKEYKFFEALLPVFKPETKKVFKV
ncbi:MAG: hypothetical protein PHS92_04530 [Candidatus Gracilibacteria bacterium]|nr:hypothetical protein [Candidatus Gracilibacteria bacterium]